MACNHTLLRSLILNQKLDAIALYRQYHLFPFPPLGYDFSTTSA
ncbi:MULTISPECIES: hypothetical protein [unclassified Nostoc]|nr:MULTISPECIES: hypothetical protein [unclassified Nostoc]